MEDWLFFLYIVLILSPIFIGVIVISSCMLMNQVTEMMEHVFLGKATEGLNIALKSDLAPADLCKPLTAETLARIHACTQVKRARVHTALRKKMKLLLGVVELDVTYDFEGTEPDGQTLTVHQNGCIRVAAAKPRYSNVLIICSATLMPEKG